MFYRKSAYQPAETSAEARPVQAINIEEDFYI